MNPFVISENVASRFWQNAVERTGWILIHSLWQFLLVAALAALITCLMERRSARSRHGILVLAMASCVAAPLVTWLTLSADGLESRTVDDRLQDRQSSGILPSNSAHQTSGTTDRLSGHPAVVVRGENATENRSGASASSRADSSHPFMQWTHSLESLVRPWLTWVVTTWFAGVTFCSLRPVAGWHMLKRLRHVGVSPVSDDVQTAVARVSLKLGVRRVVSVLQSSQVQAPVVIGYLRPVILLPLTLLTSIPPSQLEAILAHELAHIRRHDFVINLLQTLVETLFFYHPAVWWLSHRIRIEREHCCDDLVVVSLGNKLDYGRALLAVAEFSGNNSLFALGATDGSLLSRVRRVLRASVDQSADRLNERRPVAIFMLSVTGFVLAMSISWHLSAKDEASKDPSEANTTLDRRAIETGSPDAAVEPKFPTGPATPDEGSPQSDTVVGTLVGLDGKPVAGIKLHAFEGGGPLDLELKTDERGEFRVPRKWRNTEHFLTLVARDGTDQIGWFDFYFHGHSNDGQKPDDGSFKFVLLPLNRTVRGRVTNSAGDGLAEIRLQVDYLQHETNFASAHWRYQSLEGQPLIRGAITDPDGRFELKLPANTSGWLGIVNSEWVGRRINFVNDNNDLAATALKPAAKVAGRVIDSRTGKPMANVGIAAQATEPDMDTGGWGEARTDADGNYVIGGLPAREFAVLLFKTSFKTLTAAAARVSLKSGETQRVDFSLIVGSRIAGRVVDSMSGLPVTGCTVNYSGPARPGPAVLSAKTDANGDFEFFVPPGKCQLYIGEHRESVPGASIEVDVPEDFDPKPVVLKAGPKLDDQGIKIFVGRPLDRKITAHFENLTLIEALERVCQTAAVKLEMGDEIKLIKEPINLDVDAIKLRSALTLILDRFEELAFENRGDHIFVGEHKDVTAINSETINARLDQPFRCTYDDRRLNEVLEDIASRLRIRMQIDEADLRAANLEAGLTARATVETKDLYRQVVRNPDLSSNWAESIRKRKDGTITGRELLQCLLEPVGLDFYLIDDTLHVSSREKAEERNRAN